MSDESKPTERDEEAVRKAVQTLANQFDYVQIFVGRYEGNDVGTYNYCYGEGDWFGRYALVKQWILARDEEARIKARKDSKDE